MFVQYSSNSQKRIFLHLLKGYKIDFTCMYFLKLECIHIYIAIIIFNLFLSRGYGFENIQIELSNSQYSFPILLFSCKNMFFKNHPQMRIILTKYVKPTHYSYFSVLEFIL